jgi:transcriptional regulator with XRE-family HTH domain
MKLFKKYFGKKLETAMRSKGLNQKQFAELLGVEPPTISRWVTGENLPEDDRLPKICEALGVNENYFNPDYKPLESHEELFGLAVRTLATLNEDQVRDVIEFMNDLPKLESFDRAIDASLNQKLLKTKQRKF